MDPARVDEGRAERARAAHPMDVSHPGGGHGLIQLEQAPPRVVRKIEAIVRARTGRLQGIVVR